MNGQPSPDDDFGYIVVTLTPEEELFVERVVNILYYLSLSFLTIVGLVWLANRPHKK